MNAPPRPRQGPSLVAIYSLILVLGALKVCMILLNGVEDHIADAAGVTAAQSWRDRDTGSKVTVRTSSVHPQKAAAAAAKVLPTVKILYRLAIKVLFLTLYCRRILLIGVHLEKI